MNIHVGSAMLIGTVRPFSWLTGPQPWRRLMRAKCQGVHTATHTATHPHTHTPTHTERDACRNQWADGSLSHLAKGINVSPPVSTAMASDASLALIHHAALHTRARACVCVHLRVCISARVCVCVCVSSWGGKGTGLVTSRSTSL